MSTLLKLSIPLLCSFSLFSMDVDMDSGFTGGIGAILVATADADIAVYVSIDTIYDAQMDESN